MSTPVLTQSAGCPNVGNVTAHLLGYPSTGNPAAFLIGFDEGIFSTPRKRYRRGSMTGTVNSHDPSRSPVATYAVAGNGPSDNYYNPDGSQSSPFNNPDLTQTPGNFGGTDEYFAWSQLTQPPPVTGTWWVPFSGQDTAWTSSTTQVWTPVPVGTGNTGSGSLTFTLSEEDTPADAVTRLMTLVTPWGTVDITAGPVIADMFTAGICTLWEKANDAGGFPCQFGYQQGTYDTHYVGLAPGQNYHEVVVWEERDATGNGTGNPSGYGSTWANCATDSSDFTASATTQDITGRTMPVAAGKQRRIKSINVTPV